jgi:hypothetical protein
MNTKQNQGTLVVVAATPEEAEDFYRGVGSHWPYAGYQYLNSRAVLYTVESLKIALLNSAKEYRDWPFVSERIKSDGHEVVYGAEILN